ncbi:autotransporter outer membrane beta-barrel domain-containing protein [Pseudomonas sp. TMP25]|uniref:autotransporter family protein n=1 Tax=Pseudomonas sp. TMP25 TaxID=3136561 RepID=UPI0031013559
MINNSGTISGGTADDSLEGYSIKTEGSSGSATINNLQNGILRGSLFLEGSGTSLINAGLIDFQKKNDSGYVQGSFTQTATGTLRFTAAGDNSEGDYSQLRVEGIATIAGKADVNVKQINTLAIGQTLERVVRAGELNGNFTQVTDNSALFNFVSVATQGDDGFINFNIVKGLTAVESVNSNNNPSGLGAAGALDTIIDRGTTNPDMQRLVTALGELGTAQEVSDAVSQTTPLLAANAALASRAALGGINRVIEARMDANNGMSSGDEFYGDSKLWLKPFGSWADQDDRSGVSGFDANTAGLVVGADATLSERTRVGVAFAYAKSDVNGNSNVAPNSADIDMYQVIGYGSYSLDQDIELNFQAGIGQNTTDGKKDILLLGETAKANYDSLLATAGVGLARTFTLSDKTTFTPSVRTDYTWIKDEGYTEKGSSANLKVDSQTTDQLVLGIDGKISHEVMAGTRLVANLGVGYDALNDQSSINSAFAGEPSIGFTTRGLDTSPWRQSAGVGVIHEAANGMEVSLRYDTEHSEGFLNQTASIKARWDF